MQNYKLLLLFILCSTTINIAVADNSRVKLKANQVGVDSTDFNGLFTTSDTVLQSILDKIDDDTPINSDDLT